ncbi:sodium/hydrogen exchanger [Legionella anisa]|nr:sodium/hydrogen exchanger [Legionella anisa]KTC71992.1 Ca2+/Na+ antiporter [Legionella anisa]MCW8425575.1 sodium:calcium antiporter [Legionella anisa]MCW8448995.1 sodium:calcium antiporter [Legionella anisa]
MYMWLELFVMLVLILISAQLFSNALEHFGERLDISAGVTGSIFAAVSTALPETTVPILAIISGTADRQVNEEISVGAILGAPLMLSTLSTFIMASSVIKKRGINGRITPEITGFKRDMNFFLMAFTLAALAMFLPLEPNHSIRVLFCIILIFLYFLYLMLTFSASKALVENGHAVITNEPLLITKLGLKTNLKTILVQLILGLILLVFSAKGFIHGVQGAANSIGIPVLLLSLLIIPIATELPEKVNSVIWVRKGQDTLGFGNITGAMVFQGTLLPALGILLTPWAPSRIVLTGILVTYIASAWLRFNISVDGIKINLLFFNGILYLTYLGIVLS